MLLVRSFCRWILIITVFDLCSRPIINMRSMQNIKHFSGFSMPSLKLTLSIIEVSIICNQ